MESLQAFAVDYMRMTNVAQIDLIGRSQEARVRALLEDLTTENYVGALPHNRLALAIWYAKSPGGPDQYLLLLYNGPSIGGIASTSVPLNWKSGSQGAPFVHIEAMDVGWFLKLAQADPERLTRYQTNHEVLYFDKKLLDQPVLERFRIVTEPPGLIKGWYVSADEYTSSKTTQDLLSRHHGVKFHFGLIKTEESSDFENCRGILNLEIDQKWVPFTPEGIRAYTYYNDQQQGRAAYFLFEGGSLYRVLKFEVKSAPEYATKFGLLGKTPDDRYPEVYLRAMHPTAKPTA